MITTALLLALAADPLYDTHVCIDKRFAGTSTTVLCTDVEKELWRDGVWLQTELAKRGSRPDGVVGGEVSTEPAPLISFGSGWGVALGVLIGAGLVAGGIGLGLAAAHGLAGP